MVKFKVSCLSNLFKIYQIFCKVRQKKISTKVVKNSYKIAILEGYFKNVKRFSERVAYFL